MNAYRQAITDRLARLRLSPPPAPWRFVASIAVGGFQALGFAPDSKYLLVISSSGRGVFDSDSGELLARHRKPPEHAWYRIGSLMAEGIGPLSGDFLQIAGIHGGGLPTTTSDGWTADRLSPSWPDSFVTLSPAGADPWSLDKSEWVVKVGPRGGDDAVECFGFSWSRNHFVIATSHTLDLFRR